MGPVMQPHPFSRSLSEEAHLAGLGGRPGGGGVRYDPRLGEEEEEVPQFSQDLPGIQGFHRSGVKEISPIFDMLCLSQLQCS